MTKNGFTRIPNSILSQPWADNPNAIYIYTWLSLNADQNGQVTASRAELSERTGLTERQLRTALEKLIETDYVTKQNSGSTSKKPTKKTSKKTTKQKSTLTVTYLTSYEREKFQSDQETDQEKVQANDQESDQPRAYKNDNINIMSYKTKKKILSPNVESTKETTDTSQALEKRKEKFYNSLVVYVERYGKETVRAFFDYWSEANKSMTKMRFELEPTWETGRRLAYWAKKDNKFKNYAESYKHHSSVEQRREDAASIIARRLAQDDARR